MTISPVRCREIRADDIANVIYLLTNAVGRQHNHWIPRPPSYWQRALARLTDHRTPPGLPKYGYVIDAGDQLVGVILLICTAVVVDGKSQIRCNLSSWYVHPSYSVYASMLAARAIRHTGVDVTYFNLSPAPHTWVILERQGFVPFASGATVGVPLFSRWRAGADARLASAESLSPGPDLTKGEIDVLTDHAGYGCLSLVCEVTGQRHPFVFRLDRRRGLPVAHLVYCRGLDDLSLCAAPLGRHLLLRGCVFVIFASNGRASGLVGWYRGGKPLFRKGDGPIGPTDIAYSEAVMFAPRADDSFHGYLPDAGPGSARTI